MSLIPKKGTVYVVDDDEAVRDSLQWLLEGKDYRVKCFDSAESFLSRFDPREVAWAMSTRFQPARDTVVVSGTEGYIIDPSSAGDSGSKIGFDATRGAGAQFDKIAMPPAAAARARAVLSAIEKGQA